MAADVVLKITASLLDPPFNKMTKFRMGVFSWFTVCMDLLVTSPVIREECFLQKREKVHF